MTIKIRRDDEISDVDGGVVPRALALLVRQLPGPGVHEFRDAPRVQRRSADPGRRLADAPAPRHRRAHVRRGGELPPPGRCRRCARAAACGLRPADDARVGRLALGAERERDRGDAIHPDLDPARGAGPRAGCRAEGLHEADRTDRLLRGDQRRRRRRRARASGRARVRLAPQPRRRGGAPARRTGGASTST